MTDIEKPAPSKKRVWIMAGFRLTVFYALLCFVVYLGQYWLLYPSVSMSMEAVERKVSRSASLTLWPETSENYRGFVAHPEDGVTSGTIVVLHGNGGDAMDRDFLVPPFRPLGYRVILLEYTGYGARPGNVGEAQMVPDVVESLAMIHDEFGDPLFLIGESLGAGVAAAALSKTDTPVAGVALFTPWATLPDLAAKRFWFLPASWIVSDRYDSIENLRDYTGPIAVYTAEQDEIIPTQESKRLYESLVQEEKKWVLMKGVGHNTWPLSFGRSEAGELMRFLDGGEE